MTLPTIHSNGTSARALYDQQAAAVKALRNAIKAVEDAGPNARDYYLQAGATQQAINEHCNRIGRLVSVREELQAIMEHVTQFVK